MLLLLALLPLADDRPAPRRFSLTVAAGKHARANELVRVPLVVTGDNVPHGSLHDAEGKAISPVAVVKPSLLTESIKAPKGERRLDACFILPSLDAGKSATFELRLEGPVVQDKNAVLRWSAFEGSATLLRGPLEEKGVPVLQYEAPELDEANREATFKPFHHLHDEEGKLVTKGVGGQFTHHRGLFYGFMKASYGKNTVDIWHCKEKTHQAHKRTRDQARANTVLGGHRVAIDWNGVGGKTFATEEREVTAIPMPGGTLVEFTSRLTPTGDDVKLDGDPQHAGFHFRASNEVAAKSKGETYFLRPSGIGKPGTETNWPGNKKHVDLPWLAMSFVMGGQRYTTAYIDHPANPKEARFSERTYGRFGSYFVTTATKDKPLLVRYRLWLQKGEMKPAALEALSRAFVDPVVAKTTPKR